MPQCTVLPVAQPEVLHFYQTDDVLIFFTIYINPPLINISDLSVVTIPQQY